MKVIILAAGQGKRMRSETPKTLHEILGKPILQYVTDACMKAGLDDITVIAAPGYESIQKILPASVHYALQREQRGTGHALMAARAHIRDDDEILVLNGDMPLITPSFLKKLVAFQSEQNAEAVSVAVYWPGSTDFGRVYTDDNDRLIKIVEQKDLTDSAPKSDWANTGVYAFKGKSLLYGLDHLTDSNNQHEYYLTDVPGILREAGYSTKVFRATEDPSVFTGVNSQAQLAQALSFMRARVNQRHMDNGVRMLDPASTFIDYHVKLSPGVVLYPGVILEGRCVIEGNAVIGPNTRLTNTTVGSGSSIQYSVAVDAAVGRNTEVGPFAYLRPMTEIGDHCKIGDFVEVKNATVGDHTKASHLAYIGDADVGQHVNFSCGAITVNYDGKKKHRTTVEDYAFIGCNSNLVAPVNVKEGAFVAAGSTITEDIPSGALAIARQRQTNKANWKRH